MQPRRKRVRPSLPRPSSGSSSGESGGEQKPSVKQELENIRKEQAAKKEEKAKSPQRQNKTPGRNRRKKKEKIERQVIYMDLSKMIKNREAEQQESQPDGQRLSKEEYAAMKKAEREDLWARVDAQAQEVFRDDTAMKGFFDFMARCTPQSTRNLLILYDQNPEITHPRTFEKWKEAGRSVRTGETGYAFLCRQANMNGKTARWQTAMRSSRRSTSARRGGRSLIPRKPHLPEEVIAAMIESSPVPLALSDQLPQGVQAQYVPKQRTIYVRNGMDEMATLCAIAREQAHASFDAVGAGYYRQAYAAQSYCAAYVVAQKFGLDTLRLQVR